MALIKQARWMVLAGAALLAACGGPVKTKEEENNGYLSEPYIRAVAFLQEQSHASDPAVRANCIEALQMAKDPRAQEVIEAGLHDEQPLVRFAAAMAAGKRQARSSLPTLETMAASDESKVVRVGAIYALAKMGRTNHENDLAVYLLDNDPSIRANTAFVLGLLGNDSAVGMLESRKNDPDIRVRFELTAAMARLGDEAAQKIIVSESINRYGEDQWSAMMVCGDLPENLVRSPLVAGLTDVPANVPPDQKDQANLLTARRQLVAARSLAQHNDGSGVEVAIKNLKNPDPGLRALALLALGDMLRPREVPGLVPYLADPDDGVKRAAAAAIVEVYNVAESKP